MEHYSTFIKCNKSWKIQFWNSKLNFIELCNFLSFNIYIFHFSSFPNPLTEILLWADDSLWIPVCHHIIPLSSALYYHKQCQLPCTTYPSLYRMLGRLAYLYMHPSNLSRPPLFCKVTTHFKMTVSICRLLNRHINVLQGVFTTKTLSPVLLCSRC